MNILKRPGWLHYDLLEEAGPGKEIVDKKRFGTKVGGLEWGGKELMQSPQHEAYRFVGQVILDDEELAPHFPTLTAPRLLRSSSFNDVAPEIIEKLRAKLDEIYADDEKFKSVLYMMHAGRRAQTRQELETKGRVDAREKHRYWKKMSGEETPAVEPEGPPAREEDLTAQEIANVDRAQFQVAFAPIYAKIGLDSGETVADAMQDHPELMDVVTGSRDVFDFLDRLISLITSGEPVAEVAEEIYDKVKGKFIKGAEQVMDRAESSAGVPEELKGFFAGKKEQEQRRKEHGGEEPPPASKEVDVKNLGAVKSAAERWLSQRGMMSPEEEAEYQKSLRGESARLSARQVDQMLLEQRRKARQYRTIMEERYGR